MNQHHTQSTPHGIPTSIGTWTTSTPLPGTVNRSQAIVTKNRVYLLGGVINGSPSSTVYTASINSDGTLGTWTTSTPLPGTVNRSQAIVTKNRVYLLGGDINGGYSSTVYTAPINLDGTLGAWTTSTPLPGTVHSPQAIVTKNRVYLLGGYIDSASSSTVYTAPINLDGTLGAWTTSTSLPATVYYSQAIVTKNRVYLLGGLINGGHSSTVYTAPINLDGTLGAWTTSTSLPGTVYSSQAIVTKNHVYLLGGVINNVPSSTVYTAPVRTSTQEETTTNHPKGTNMNKQELIKKAAKAVERSVDAVRNATGSELAFVYVIYPYTTTFDKSTDPAFSIAMAALDDAQLADKDYFTATIVYSPGVEEMLQSQNCVVFKLTQPEDDCEEETLDIEIYHSLSRDTVHTFSASGREDSWEAESRTPKVQPEKDRQELEEIYTQAINLAEFINKETNGGWGGFLNVGGHVLLPVDPTNGQAYFSPLGITTFFTIKEEVTRLMSQCMEQNLTFTTTMQLWVKTEHVLKHMEIKECYHATLSPMTGQPFPPPYGSQYPSMYGQAMQQTPPWKAMPQNYGNPGFQMQPMHPGMYVQMYTGQPMGPRLQPRGQTYHYTRPTKGKKD